MIPCERYAPPIAAWTERSTASGLDWMSSVQLVDVVQRVEVGDAARVGDGDEAVELPEVLHGQGDALLVGEAPHDLGGDRAAEVRVELGEALREVHPPSVLRHVRRIAA